MLQRVHRERERGRKEPETRGKMSKANAFLYRCYKELIMWCRELLRRDVHIAHRNCHGVRVLHV